MIRCVHCPCPVHPTRGGAYCVAHTPVDLTGGVSPGDATDRLHALGNAPRRRRGRISSIPETLAAQWVELYGAGASTYALEKQFGISCGQIHYYLRRAGVVLRPHGKARAAS